MKLILFIFFRNRNRKYGVNTISQCCVCGVHFNKGQVQRRRVRCQECDGWACRAACSLYLRREGVWLCTQCRKPSSWFRALLTCWTAKAGTSHTTVQNNLLEMPKQDATTNTSNTNRTDDKEVVRDFIERLVGSMLEANLDDTSVNRLYRDPECK